MIIKHIGGTGSSLFFGACCLGLTPLLAAFTALGAGFLIRDAILIPLFLASLAFSLWSLTRSRARHRRPGPFRLGLGSALVAFAALWFLPALAYAALASFAGAAAWDLVALRRCEAECAAAEVAGAAGEPPPPPGEAALPGR